MKKWKDLEILINLKKKNRHQQLSIHKGCSIVVASTPPVAHQKIIRPGYKLYMVTFFLSIFSPRVRHGDTGAKPKLFQNLHFQIFVFQNFSFHRKLDNCKLLFGQGIDLRLDRDQYLSQLGLVFISCYLLFLYFLEALTLYKNLAYLYLRRRLID